MKYSRDPTGERVGNALPCRVAANHKRCTLPLPPVQYRDEPVFSVIVADVE